MKINGRMIGGNNPPYIVAEIGASHGGDFDRCILLMGAAAGAGADAIKFQCYTPDTITIDCDKPDFIIKDGPWKGRSLYELYEKAHTPWEWFPDIFLVAKEHGQTVFASVFDKTSVDYLEGLGCPAYKIASMEIVDIPLIEYVAKTGKPIIISTGMASDVEIVDAGRAAKPHHLFLHCVSGYPSKVEEMDLVKGMYFMRGISDHSPGWEVPVAATALGVDVIEKHIKWWDDTISEDAGFALDPDEFRMMCKAVKNIWGSMQPSKAKSEESSRQLRRSLYVVEDIKQGEMFTEGNVRSIRPAYGLPPKDLPRVLGQVARHDLERGTALSWDLIASS